MNLLSTVLSGLLQTATVVVARRNSGLRFNLEIVGSDNSQDMYRVTQAIEDVGFRHILIDAQTGLKFRKQGDEDYSNKIALIRVYGNDSISDLEVFDAFAGTILFRQFDAEFAEMHNSFTLKFAPSFRTPDA